MDNETVTLVPGLLIMKQALYMSIFHTIDWKLTGNILSKNKQGIRMMIVMKRKIISEMMTTYFPSVLLTIITFATTFFKPFFFEEASLTGGLGNLNSLKSSGRLPASGEHLP